MANSTVVFKYGSLDAFEKLGSYDSNALYFIHDDATDTNMLYKGEYKMADKYVIICNSLPSPIVGREDRLYVVNEEEKARIYVFKKNGDLGEYIEITSNNSGELIPGAITDTDVFDDDVLLKSESGDNDQIPTVGAVDERIEEAKKELEEQLEEAKKLAEEAKKAAEEAQEKAAASWEEFK